MILLVLFSLVVFALMFPETSVGKFAKRYFVEAPGNWLNNLNVIKLFAVIMVTTAIVVCSTAFPPGMALIAAGDLTAYIEIVAALTLVISRLRIRHIFLGASVIMRHVLLKIVRLKGSVRIRAPRISSRAKSSSDKADDDSARACVFAS